MQRRIVLLVAHAAALFLGNAALGCSAGDGVESDPQTSTGQATSGAGAGDLGTGGDSGDLSGAGGSTGTSSGECAFGATQDCYPGDQAEVGVGVCASGTQTCEGSGEFGHWGDCTGAVEPTAEICGDNLDNDCDGTVDNGCCTPMNYTLTTGFTASGGSVCCMGTDMLLGATDCGDGDDHWVMAQGSCGFAYEGSNNNGGPCVTIQCAGQMCM